MFTKKSLTSAVLTGVAILGLSSIAYADLPGYYVTGQLGQSNSEFGAGDHIGLAGGLFGGFQFTPYIAAELGYVQFHSTHFNSTPVIVGPGVTIPGTSGSIKQQAGEGDLKFILPLPCGFNLFAKGGLAYVDTSGTVSGIGFVGSSQDWRPLYGAGASYDLTPNVTADVSWTRIQNNNNIPSINFTAVGLSYYFG